MKIESHRFQDSAVVVRILAETEEEKKLIDDVLGDITAYTNQIAVPVSIGRFGGLSLILKGNEKRLP